MEFKDYYATLGVGRRATADEVKTAFRTLARRYHPDVNPGDRAAERRFKEVSEAYEVLGNPERRRTYDQLGADWTRYAQAAPGGPGPGAGARVRFHAGGPGGGARTLSEEEVRRLFGGDPFSDFFQTFFGGAAAPAQDGRGAPDARGRDVEHPLALTIEEAFRGVTRRIALSGAGPRRSVEVRIPRGVDEGARIRVAGAGRPGPGGGPPGDLYLRIRLAPHQVYTRTGRDLHRRVDIPLTTAVLGGEVALPTIGGGAVRLKVPPATQPGQVLRIAGQGMPAGRGAGARGNLYATAHVRLPRSVTPEERKHFEALAALDAARAPVAGDSAA